MNDRYLLRAKRTDNGEWCIGNLVYYPDGTTDIGETGGDWMIHKVDPSSASVPDLRTRTGRRSGRMIFSDTAMIILILHGLQPKG